MAGLAKRVMGSLAGGSVVLLIAATVQIHPHYLSYFNWASGGPDRVPGAIDRQQPRLGARPRRVRAMVQDEHPRPADRARLFRADQSFDLRDPGEPFRWFLPPVRPKTTLRMPMDSQAAAALIGPAPGSSPV